MKAFIVLVLLVVGGWFAYSHFIAGDAADADAGAGAAEDGELGDLEASDAPGEAGATAPGELPADAKAALERADQRWQELAAAGDPTTSSEAVVLARDYSQALHAAYNDPGLASLRRRLIRERLAPLGDRIFFSSTPYPDDPTDLIGTHTVKSGDRLADLGREYGMSAEFFNILRGRDDIFADDLRIGESLKVVKATQRSHPAADWTEGYHYHVDKSEFVLDVFIEGVFVRRFPVGIGAEATPTPVGTSYIELREKTPGQWTTPEGDVVYPGDPRFIIGEYWIRINPQIGASGIGFHTYTGEGPVTGAKVSNGCIRLENEDIETFYALTVPVVTTQAGEFITRSPMSVEITE